jgi:type II secretory ATPase GspE/PulE/Tfp pilus assembly ATPase PilB-like protein/ActR/RegA family two-component response regulator
MPDESRSPGHAHWLVRVARDAGLPGAGALVVAPSTTLSDAWQEVARGTGIDTSRLADAVAQRFRLERWRLEPPEPRALQLVPESLAREHGVLPLREDDRRLVVATADPTAVTVEQTLQFASGRHIAFAIAPPQALAEAVLEHYAPDRAAAAVLDRLDTSLEESLRVVEESEPSATPEALASDLASGPVARLTNVILQEGLTMGASDIHLQPLPHAGTIRYRVDGVLRPHGTLPLPVLTRVISRIKIMARMDISDRLRPQDGRTRVAFQGRELDLRISTVPTRKAEKAVIRVLDPGAVRTLEDLGVPPEALARFHELLGHRSGIVVVTGPTGSGKTTTLYAALQAVMTEDINIMTVEDPVEYELPGLTQIQVEPKQGVTFPSALRAILRQDPDVIFVGEIRDAETASIAVQASLTGHLVLATLHTNDAVGAVRRLQDLGLDAGAVTETLRGALAQRLVRRLCTACAEPVEAGLSAREEELAELFGARPRFRAVGCDRCGQTGYRGRLPVAQVFASTPELRDAIARGAGPDVLARVARLGGMRTLQEAGALFVEQGITTLEELERVLGDADRGAEDGEARAPGGAAAAPPAPAVAERATPEPAPLPSQPAREPPPLADAPPLEPVHVLVVDDDAANRTIARALLQKEGHRVTEAQDGQEALDVLASHDDVGLVLLDLSMPRVDGMQVLRTVRSAFRTAGVPVIVLTGTTEPEQEFAAMDAGADDYLRKPFEPRRLVARVRAALRRAAG